MPFFALLPFYVIGVYAGFRNMLKIWPVLLVAGGTFALTQFVTSKLHQLFARRRACLACVANPDDRISCASGNRPQRSVSPSTWIGSRRPAARFPAATAGCRRSWYRWS
ncbi:MAG: L-lactate permease [uncultured Caballeronia sp.]|nr:MAG: L-lactate permease [uncultured Caballeronia sp.]